MEKRDAFMFFRSFYEAASKIPDETDRAKYYEAIFRYALDGELSELTGVPAAMFTLTKPNLDKSWKRAEAGSKGGQSIKANSKQTASKTEAKSKNPEAIKDKGLRIKDKEVGIKDSLNTSCSEPEKSAPSGSGIFLPLNDNSSYDVPEEKIRVWEQAYPAVDIRQELLKMVSWLDANPTRRKTRRGIARFANSWLERAQNSGGDYRNNSQRYGKGDSRKDEKDSETSIQSESSVKLYC